MIYHPDGFGSWGRSQLSLRISHHQTAKESHMRRFLKPYAGYSPLEDNVAHAGKFLEFRKAFWKSGPASVDAFLEGRPES